MSLQASVLQAVKSAKAALADLAIPMTLRKRTQASYTPGAAITYANSDSSVKGVITTYNSREIDGDRIQVHDLKVIVFNELSVVPEPNDLLIITDQQYRVVRFQPTKVGSETALSTVQVRPTGA